MFSQYKELFLFYLMSRVKNLGLNRLDDDDYINIIEDDDCLSTVNQLNTRTEEAVAQIHQQMYIKGQNTKRSYELIMAFRNADTDLEKTDVLSMIAGFDPESKLNLFHEELGKMYDRVIETYIYESSPQSILNTGLHDNKRIDFIQLMTNKSRKGRNLNRLIKIYFDALGFQ